jgi:hypothetical protein
MSDFDTIFTKSLYLKNKKGGLYPHWGELQRTATGISAPLYYSNSRGDDTAKTHSKTNRPTKLFADINYVGAIDTWQWVQEDSTYLLDNLLSLKERVETDNEKTNFTDFEDGLYVSKVSRPIHMDYSQTYVNWRIDTETEAAKGDNETLTKFKGVIQTDNLNWKFPFSTLGNGEIKVVIKMNSKPTSADGNFGIFTEDGLASSTHSKHEYIKNTKWKDEGVAGSIQFYDDSGVHTMTPSANQSINNADIIFQHVTKDLAVGDYILITYSSVTYDITTTFKINGLWKVSDIGGDTSKWELTRAHDEWDWTYSMFKCTNTYDGTDFSALDPKEQYIEFKSNSKTFLPNGDYDSIITNIVPATSGLIIEDDNFSNKYKNSVGQLYKISAVPHEDYVGDNLASLRLVINNTLIYSGLDKELKEVEEPTHSGLYRRQMEKIFFSTQRDIIIDGEFSSGKRGTGASFRPLQMDFKLELLSILEQ